MKKTFLATSALLGVLFSYSSNLLAVILLIVTGIFAAALIVSQAIELAKKNDGRQDFLAFAKTLFFALAIAFAGNILSGTLSYFYNSASKRNEAEKIIKKLTEYRIENGHFPIDISELRAEIIHGEGFFYQRVDSHDYILSYPAPNRPFRSVSSVFQVYNSEANEWHENDHWK